MTENDLESYRKRCLELHMPDPLEQCFNSGVEFTNVLVQEMKTKRMHVGTLKTYNESKRLWRIEFELQEDNPGLGSWNCDEEVQLADLRTLKLHAAEIVKRSQEPRGTRIEGKGLKPTPDGCVACHVEIEPMMLPTDNEFYSFWVSKEHFGEDFVFNKLQPLMLSVKGTPTNLATVQR